MNILPLLPDPSYSPSKPDDAVRGVRAIARPKDATQDTPEEKLPAPQVLDALERETLVETYNQHYAQNADPQEKRSQQAINAYQEVALAPKREALEEVLGISEYA